MRRFVRSLCLIALTSLLGPVACSDPSFETAEPAGPDARDGSDDGDASDGSDESDARDARDAREDADDVATGDAQPDADAAATDGDASCTPNECGGCATLSAAPGAACGDCGDGKWTCDGVDALKCEGATALNACGGCADLANAPGAPCGTCGTSKYVCAADAKSTACAKPDDRNACGGCTSLPTLGATCGRCSSGEYVCDGTDAVKCDDPVPVFAISPGTPCGTCKTKTYTCTADKKDTVCAGPDDVNACGGCGTLAGVPGATCGTCGKWSCSGDKASVACAEASPAAGSACGICGKSTYACSGLATTTCSKPDDRLPYLDANADAPSGTIEHASHKNRLGFSYVTKRGGHLVNVRLRVQREAFQCGATLTTPHPDPACTSCVKLPGGATFFCSVPDAAKVAGSATLSIFSGTPAIGMTLLTSVTLSSDALGSVSSAEGWVDFTPTAPIAIEKDKPIFFELSTDSTTWQFRWSEAGVSPVGSTFLLWRRSIYPAGTWESQTRARGTKVDILSCADF